MSGEEKAKEGQSSYFSNAAYETLRQKIDLLDDKQDNASTEQYTNEFWEWVRKTYGPQSVKVWHDYTEYAKKESDNAEPMNQLKNLLSQYEKEKEKEKACRETCQNITDIYLSYLGLSSRYRMEVTPYSGRWCEGGYSMKFYEGAEKQPIEIHFSLNESGKIDDKKNVFLNAQIDGYVAGRFISGGGEDGMEKIKIGIMSIIAAVIQKDDGKENSGIRFVSQSYQKFNASKAAPAQAEPAAPAPAPAAAAAEPAPTPTPAPAAAAPAQPAGPAASPTPAQPAAPAAAPAPDPKAVAAQRAAPEKTKSFRATVNAQPVAKDDTAPSGKSYIRFIEEREPDGSEKSATFTIHLVGDDAVQNSRITDFVGPTEGDYTPPMKIEDSKLDNAVITLEADSHGQAKGTEYKWNRNSKMWKDENGNRLRVYDNTQIKLEFRPATATQAQAAEAAEAASAKPPFTKMTRAEALKTAFVEEDASSTEATKPLKLKASYGSDYILVQIPDEDRYYIIPAKPVDPLEQALQDKPEWTFEEALSTGRLEYDRESERWVARPKYALLTRKGRNWKVMKQTEIDALCLGEARRSGPKNAPTYNRSDTVLSKWDAVKSDYVTATVVGDKLTLTPISGYQWEVKDEKDREVSGNFDVVPVLDPDQYDEAFIAAEGEIPDVSPQYDAGQSFNIETHKWNPADGYEYQGAQMQRGPEKMVKDSFNELWELAQKMRIFPTQDNKNPTDALWDYIKTQVETGAAFVRMDIETLTIENGEVKFVYLVTEENDGRQKQKRYSMNVSAAMARDDDAYSEGVRAHENQEVLAPRIVNGEFKMTTVQNSRNNRRALRAFFRQVNKPEELVEKVTSETLQSVATQMATFEQASPPQHTVAANRFEANKNRALKLANGAATPPDYETDDAIAAEFLLRGAEVYADWATAEWKAVSQNNATTIDLSALKRIEAHLTRASDLLDSVKERNDKNGGIASVRGVIEAVTQNTEYKKFKTAADKVTLGAGVEDWMTKNGVKGVLTKDDEDKIVFGLASSEGTLLEQDFGNNFKLPLLFNSDKVTFSMVDGTLQLKDEWSDHQGTKYNCTFTANDANELREKITVYSLRYLINVVRQGVENTESLFSEIVASAPTIAQAKARLVELERKYSGLSAIEVTQAPVTSAPAPTPATAPAAPQ